MLPLWKKYSNHISDIWDSLAIFLEGYAFERQGRRPDYAPAAVNALFHYEKQNSGDIRQSAANDIWQHFARLLNNRGLNEKMNPLYPRQSTPQKPSLMEMILNRGIVQQNVTFTTHFRNQINQNNNIQNAFNSVKSIRGVGDKITSLYLRDLVDVMNISANNVENRHLLQPIDVWVARTVKILANNQGMNPHQIANWIVSISTQHKINAERVNMGMWFLGSNIIASEYKLRNILKNLYKARDLVNDFKTRIRNLHRYCLNFT